MLNCLQDNNCRELITPKSQGGSAAQESFEVAKTGDARIGFVGFPSVGWCSIFYCTIRIEFVVNLHQVSQSLCRNTAFSGKSTLLSNLAGVYSEVAAYEFTTLTTVPGCIKYKVRRVLDLASK